MAKKAVLKNKAIGRPPKFTKKSEVLSLFVAYVKRCEKKKQIPNKAGLCLALNLTRESYREYKAKPEFVDTLKRIEFIIENAWLQRLTSNSPTGAIFYLKNAFKEQYKDRHETDVTSKGEKIIGITYITPSNANNHKD